MAQITFDNLKKNCVAEWRSKNASYNCEINTSGKLAVAQLVELKQTGKFKNPWTLKKEIEKECVDTIERIDIRNIKALAELCPESVPSWIKRGFYTVDISDSGWTIFKKEL